MNILVLLFIFVALASGQTTPPDPVVICDFFSVNSPRFSGVPEKPVFDPEVNCLVKPLATPQRVELTFVFGPLPGTVAPPGIPLVAVHVVAVEATTAINWQRFAVGVDPRLTVLTVRKLTLLPGNEGSAVLVQ